MTQDHNAEQAGDLPAAIGAPARRALSAAGYTSLAQLSAVSEAELLQLHGMGPKAIGLLSAALAAQGLAFASGGPAAPAGSASPARAKAGEEVAAYLARLEHPLKAEIAALRAIIAGVDPRIRESIKWNAPSFALDDHFATLKLRPETSVQVVLHTGAKVKASPQAMRLDDPDGLLKWAAPDRAVVSFADMADVRSKETAFVAVLRQWIEQL